MPCIPRSRRGQRAEVVSLRAGLWAALTRSAARRARRSLRFVRAWTSRLSVPPHRAGVLVAERHAGFRSPLCRSPTFARPGGLAAMQHDDVALTTTEQRRTVARGVVMFFFKKAFFHKAGVERAVAALNEALVAAREGDARAHFDTALALASKTGELSVIFQVPLAYAHHLHQRGHHDLARDQLLSWTRTFGAGLENAELAADIAKLIASRRAQLEALHPMHDAQT